MGLAVRFSEVHSQFPHISMGIESEQDYIMLAAYNCHYARTYLTIG